MPPKLEQGSASPAHVTSGPFVYGGPNGLQANGHTRCPPGHLYDLLMRADDAGCPPSPMLKKNGQLRANQPAPHKDQSASFYEAQLLHYGMKPRKTKGAAKHALLVAFAGDRKGLKVPPSLLKLEKDMAALFNKKEKLAEQEQSLMLSGGGGASSVTAGQCKGAGAVKKRKAEEDSRTPASKKTKQKARNFVAHELLATLKGVVNNTPQSEASAQKTKDSAATDKKKAKPSEGQGSKKSGKSAEKKLNDPSKKSSASVKTSGITATSQSIPKSTASKTGSAVSHSNKNPKASNAQSGGTVKKEPSTAASGPSRFSGSPTKQRPQVKTEKPPAKKPSKPSPIGGVYTLSIPRSENADPSRALLLFGGAVASLADVSCTLEMHLSFSDDSADKSVLWGRFDMGTLRGYMRTPRAVARRTAPAMVVLSWRGTRSNTTTTGETGPAVGEGEGEENEGLAGKDNALRVRFQVDGRVELLVHWEGGPDRGVRFEGKRNARAGVAVKQEEEDSVIAWQTRYAALRPKRKGVAGGGSGGHHFKEEEEEEEKWQEYNDDGDAETCETWDAHTDRSREDMEEDEESYGGWGSPDDYDVFSDDGGWDRYHDA